MQTSHSINLYYRFLALTRCLCTFMYSTRIYIKPIFAQLFAFDLRNSFGEGKNNLKYTCSIKSRKKCLFVHNNSKVVVSFNIILYTNTWSFRSLLTCFIFILVFIYISAKDYVIYIVAKPASFFFLHISIHNQNQNFLFKIIKKNLYSNINN